MQWLEGCRHGYSGRIISSSVKVIFNIKCQLSLEVQNVLYLYAAAEDSAQISIPFSRASQWVLPTRDNFYMTNIPVFLPFSATIKSGRNLSMICKRKSRNLRSGSHTLYDPSTKMLRRLLLSMLFQKPKQYWSWTGQWSFYPQVIERHSGIGLGRKGNLGTLLWLLLKPTTKKSRFVWCCNRA